MRNRPARKNSHPALVRLCNAMNAKRTAEKYPNEYTDGEYIVIVDEHTAALEAFQAIPDRTDLYRKVW